MSISRREFLSISAITGTHVLLNNLDAVAKPLDTAVAPGYSLLVFATNWGYTGTWDEFCEKIKKLGYDGAELWLPKTESEQQQMFSTFGKHNLKIGLLAAGSSKDARQHLEEFRIAIDKAVEYTPVYINCHSGKDYFTVEQNQRFIELTTQVTKASGVPIHHETHRSRILYSAPVARTYIESRPDLRITLDASHWCNVHESNLEDQAETVNLALERVDHIHARIGHSQGPQVNDPRAPEWKTYVDAHFRWWDKVVEKKKREGKQMTFLTEFGPVDYMPALPFTRQPIANQWDINKYMLDTLRARYS